MSETIKRRKKNYLSVVQQKKIFIQLFIMCLKQFQIKILQTFLVVKIYIIVVWHINNEIICFQYKTERDGVVETRMEQKITIQSDGDPIDHDKALAEAIQEATAMNPDMTVEKIEIQQQTTQP